MPLFAMNATRQVGEAWRARRRTGVVRRLGKVHPHPGPISKGRRSEDGRSHTISGRWPGADWPVPVATRFTALTNARVAASTVSVDTPRPR